MISSLAGTSSLGAWKNGLWGIGARGVLVRLKESGDWVLEDMLLAGEYGGLMVSVGESDLSIIPNLSEGMSISVGELILSCVGLILGAG
jgi:hypothetical protein